MSDWLTEIDRDRLRSMLDWPRSTDMISMLDWPRLTEIYVGLTEKDCDICWIDRAQLRSTYMFNLKLILIWRRSSRSWSIWRRYQSILVVDVDISGFWSIWRKSVDFGISHVDISWSWSIRRLADFRSNFRKIQKFDRKSAIKCQKM